MSGNLSMADIISVYQTLITSASKDMTDWKEKIGTRASTPQENLEFNIAVSNWEMVNTASSKAISSVADTMKESLRQR